MTKEHKRLFQDDKPLADCLHFCLFVVLRDLIAPTFTTKKLGLASI